MPRVRKRKKAIVTITSSSDLAEAACLKRARRWHEDCGFGEDQDDHDEEVERRRRRR